MDQSNQNLPHPELRGLPGEELVRQGFSDIRSGILSVSALLVAIGAPRLRLLGMTFDAEVSLPEAPEILLYRLLVKGHPGDAYSQYNSLIRRLVSFERAYEQQRRRQRLDEI